MQDIRSVLFNTKGAAKAVAERLGISQAAVSQWRERGIPARRLADVSDALANHVRAINAEEDAR